MNNEPNFDGEKMKMPSESNVAVHEDNATRETKGIFIFGMVAALLVILIGLIYWYVTATVPTETAVEPLRPTAEMNQEPETTTATAQVESFGAMSTSDELTAIEADLESTGLDSLDAELTQIDTELETSVTE